MHPKIESYLKQHKIGFVASYKGSSWRDNRYLEKTGEDMFILTDFSKSKKVEECEEKMTLEALMTILESYKWLPQCIAFEMEKEEFR